MKFKNYIISAVCVFALCSCSGNISDTNHVNVVPDIKPVSEISTEAVSATAAEAAVTENTMAETEAVTEPVVKYDINDIRIKQDDNIPDYLYSVLNDYSSCFYVENGYYKINFLANKEFEEKINSDIHEAMDSLKKQNDEDYGYDARAVHADMAAEADGIFAEFICRNGFLSVLLEYGSYDMYKDSSAGGYSSMRSPDIRFDHVMTLNYELFSESRITDFSQLFYENSDWMTAVQSSVNYEYRGNIPLFIDQKPENFTIDGIIYDTGYDFAVCRYDSQFVNLAYCRDMIASDYRDMTEICSEEVSAQVYEWYDTSEDSLLTCNQCGDVYVYEKIKSSRFYSDEEIQEYNKKLDQLYDRGVPGREAHYCDGMRCPPGRFCNYTPEWAAKEFGFNLWVCKDSSGLNFYDPATFEKISINDVLGYEWQEYAEVTSEISKYTEVSEYNSIEGLKYHSDEQTVDVILINRKGMTIVLTVSAENINQKYLAQ